MVNSAGFKFIFKFDILISDLFFITAVESILKLESRGLIFHYLNVFDTEMWPGQDIKQNTVNEK